MYNSNEIAAIRAITVKPKSWRVKKFIDGTYQLEFTYVDKTRNDYAWVKASQRSNQLKTNPYNKTYKSINAVFSDIEKVTSKATVYFVGLSDSK